MSNQYFFIIQSIADLDARIGFLTSPECHFSQIKMNPIRLINCFNDMKEPKHFADLAIAFKQCFGDVVIQFNDPNIAPGRFPKLRTIMDYLYSQSKPKYKIKTLREIHYETLFFEFKKLGFRHICQCNQIDMYNSFLKHSSNNQFAWLLNEYPALNSMYKSSILHELNSFISIEDRIEYLKNVEGSLYMVNEPELILERFYDIVDIRQAVAVVDALRARLGQTIICREASHRSGEIVSIVDVLSSTNHTWFERPSRKLFLEAFELLGMKKAYCSNSNYIMSYRVYCDDHRYKNDLGAILPLAKPMVDDKLLDFHERLGLCERIDEYIECLRATDYLFNKQPFPEKYATFEVIKNSKINIGELTSDQALEIAKIFKEKFGLTIVSHMQSRWNGLYLTVMDVLHCKKRQIANRSYNLLNDAFEMLGFKYSRHLDIRILRQLYYNINSYNYPRMKKSRLQLHEELIMHVFHPIRIQRWINQGNCIDDYMM